MNKITPTGRICLKCGKPIAGDSQRCERCTSKFAQAANNQKWRLSKAKHRKWSRGTTAPEKHL